MVPRKGLEPSHLSALAPKTSVSTNSTTAAMSLIIRKPGLKCYSRVMETTEKYTPSWDLLGKSVRLVRSHPYSILWLVLIPSILNGIGEYLNPNSFTTNTDLWFTGHSAASSQVGIIAVSLGILWTLLALPATVVLGARAVRGDGDDPLSYVRQGLRYFWKIYGLGILIGILVILGLVALIVPGLILLRRYMLAPYYLVTEDIGIREAMRRSANQTAEQRKSIWGLIGVMFVISISASVISNIPALGLLLGPLVSLSYFFAGPLRQKEVSGGSPLPASTFTPKPKKS